MARPRKEGMDYFPHDVTLTTDKKVEALRILHGNDGYAFFCIMLENIYQESNFELDVSDAETIQILAKKVEVTPEKFNDMLKTSIKHGCFDRERYIQDGVLTSNGIKKRAEVVLKKRIAMRDSHGKKVSDTVSDAETTEEMPQSKSKVKASKEYTHEFEEFWLIYPRPVEKQAAFTSWNAAIKVDNPSTIILCAENYAYTCKKEETATRYIKHPASFLNKGRYKDFAKKEPLRVVKPYDPITPEPDDVPLEGYG